VVSVDQWDAINTRCVGAEPGELEVMLKVVDLQWQTHYLGDR
jgi:hypothetical protein